MKQRIVYVLTIAMLLCGKAKAQKVILPFGQFTQQPWTASYFHAPIDGETPPDNWYATDFDDSGWNVLEGPISTNSSGYRVTPWDGNYTTYWVRRHFTVNDIEEYSLVSLYAYHDDGCEIYLNGAQIYDDKSYYTNYITITMTEEMCSHFVEGDNVIAVKVSDTGGGEAFMDFGIDANLAPSLTNPNFDNGFNGWSRTGEGLTTGGQSFNYVARCLSENPFDVHQTIRTSKRGLYRLRAQAFEGFADSGLYWGWEQYKNGRSNAPYLYINDQKQIIKSIFEDAVKSNDYYTDNYFYCTPDNTYIPTNMVTASVAFRNGLYENEFYAYVDTAVFDIGIALSEQNDVTGWTVFDNFRFEHITEKELDNTISEIEALPTPPSGKDPNVLALINKLKTAKEYEAKCRIIVESSKVFANARRYSEQIALVKETVEALQHSLNTRKNTNSVVVEEAKEIIADTNNRLSAGTIAAEEVRNILSQLNDLIKRLNYVHIDLAISVPGSLGDSILNKVENFVDVQSLKVSGTLDDADFVNIQNRLTQLREIDMTDVKLVSLPNKFFYQHSLLEIVKLPSTLTSIGEYAFYECHGIKHIEFPASLTTINRFAFAICDNLQEIILPEGLTTLGNDAFSRCEMSEYIKLPSTLQTISEATFWNNKRLKNIEFSNGLTHINNRAFYQCVSLNNLKFPSSLYYIGGESFAYNRSLSNIEFNEGLFQIGDNAFYDCDALTEVTLPSSLVLANASPFDYCDNLRKVTCLSIEPPYMTDHIPYGLGMDGRELYVPALSINAYKQTSGWEKFPAIKPIDYLPENITVRTELHLTLPENIPADYKPHVELLHAMDPQYGCLTVNGAGTLSMSEFKMMYDPNLQYNNYNRNLNYCSLLNNSHLRADQVSIDVYPRNDRWTFITMPFDVKVSEIETCCDGSTNWVVRRYDGQKRANGETSETWVKLGNDEVLNAGEGYIIQSSRYIGTNRQDYSGIRMKAINNANKNKIFSTTDITVTLNEYESEFVHNRSWNLIGNPYPCYYDTRFMDFEAPITVWNMRNSTYEAYSPTDDSYILCPGEAFFIQRPIDKGNIVFGKDGRQTNRNVRVIENSARPNIRKASAANSPRTIVNLSLSDGNNTDRTRIVLNGNAMMQYEMDKDACKFMSTDATVPQIYTSSENVNYSINERPLADGTVELTTHFCSEGLHTINLVNEVSDYNVTLEDKAENKKVILTPGYGYTFYTKAGTIANRFVVHFNNEATGVEEVLHESEANVSIYSIEGIKVNVPTKKGVYIQNGKKIMLNK